MLKADRSVIVSVLLLLAFVLVVAVGCDLDELEQQNKAGECASHTWDKGVVTREMTYFREGVREYTCKNCGSKKYEPIRDDSCAYKDGNVVKRIYPGSNNDVVLYSYDKPLKVNCQHYINGELESTSVFDITQSFEPIKEIGYRPSGIIFYEREFNHSYDKLLVDNYYNGSGKLFRCDEYNSDGYLVKKTEFYNSGAKKSESIYDGTAKKKLLGFTNYSDQASTEGTGASDRQTEIEVSGDIELWIIGDVLIPWDLEVDYSIGNSINSSFGEIGHRVYSLGDTPLSLSCDVNYSDYGYYLKEEYNELTGRTDVYIVIDKSIKDPAYLAIEVEKDYQLGEHELYGHWFYSTNTAIEETLTENRNRGLFPLTNINGVRIIKVEPDTYTAPSLFYRTLPEHFDTQVSKYSVTVASGETEELKIYQTAEYTTFARIGVPDTSSYPEFSEMAQQIDLYIGQNYVGGWSNEYFPSGSRIQIKSLTSFGEDLSVTAEIRLKNGVSEDDFPYMLVPSVATLTVEEGNTYSVSFSVVEKPENRD